MRKFMCAASIIVASSGCAPPVPEPSPMDVALPDATSDVRAALDVGAEVVRVDVATDAVVLDQSIADSTVEDTSADDASMVADAEAADAEAADADVVDIRTDAPAVDALDCPVGQRSCDGTCVATMSNPSHCGGCGVACAAGPSCVSGRCECPAGQSLCAGRCVNTQANASHCGACGNECTAPQTCEAGRCALPCGPTEVACGAGAAMTCANLATDPNNCGACASACPAGRVCVARSCVCPATQTLCGGACRNTSADPMHCGACATACATGATCASGTCVCPAGLTACGGACVDTRSSNAHCGACGLACSAGQTCVGGSCASACSAPRMTCFGSCVDVQTDNANCGSCGSICTGNNICVAGRCAPTNGSLATAIVVPSSPNGISYRSTRYSLALPGVDVGGCVNGAVFYRFSLATRSIVHALVQEAFVGETAVTIVPDTGGAAIGCGPADTRCGPRTSEVVTILNPGAGDFAIAQRGAIVSGTLLGTLPLGARTDVLSCTLDQTLTSLTARGSAAGITGMLGTCSFARIPHGAGAGRTTAGMMSNTVGVVSGNGSAALCAANQVAVGITARINGGSLTGLGFRCAPHNGT